MLKGGLGCKSEVKGRGRVLSLLRWRCRRQGGSTEGRGPRGSMGWGAVQLRVAPNWVVHKGRFL